MASTTLGAARLGLVAVAAVNSASATATVEGKILARDRNRLDVRDTDGVETSVALSDDTRVTAIKGALRLRRESRSVDDLILGLSVRVEGDWNGDILDAVRISFSAKDLTAARNARNQSARAK